MSKSGLRSYAALIWFRFKTETAYFSSKWTNALSTTAYCVALILSVRLTIGPHGGIFGLTTGEVYFLMFLGQLNYYFFSSNIAIGTANWLIDTAIRAGELDLILLKPLKPTLYAITANYSILSIIRDATLPLAILAFFVPWNSLYTTPLHLLAGITLHLLGNISYCCMFIALAWTSIWHNAEASTMLTFAYQQGQAYKAPLGELPSVFKVLIFVMLPTFIGDIVAGSVILGKAPIFPWLLFATATTICMLSLVRLTEKRALLSYASASS